VNKLDAVAVIVAGGKSSRMQQDKALLPFASYNSLAEYQYQRLSKIFSKVYLSSKVNKFDFDAEVIEDIYEESSPLVALVSVFEHLKVNECFFLSVDTPFVDEEVIRRLHAHAKEEVDVVVAHSNSGLEPLCAIYKRSSLFEAKRRVALNNHRLNAFVKSLIFQVVEIEEENTFMNLNYPEDYEKAKKLKEVSW
jgi:molybdopterin-guanine dinucleotide biosynthesis protein A